jgi:hypothetical protein
MCQAEIVGYWRRAIEPSAVEIYLAFAPYALRDLQALLRAGRSTA